MEKTHSEPGHMRQLDGLRGIAVLIVVWAHWVHDDDLLGTPWADIGVQLFFVLSGFLITGILLDARRRNPDGIWFILRQFYIRRALRIFPLFLLAIGLLTFLEVAPFPGSWPWHASYLTNFYFYREGFSGNGMHFWTLAVEEQFYLIIPFLILFLPHRWVLSCLLVLFVAAPLFRSTVGTEQNWLMMPSSLDSLCCGGVLARVARNSSIKQQALFTAAMLQGAVVVYLFCHLSGHFGVLKKTCVAMVCGCVVWRAAGGGAGWRGSILGNSTLRAVGRVSYGVYVIHAFAPLIWTWLMYSAPIPGYRVMARIGVPPELYGDRVFERLAWSGLTAVLVLVSFRYFESPINGLKRHFPYVRKNSAPCETDSPECFHKRLIPTPTIDPDASPRCPNPDAAKPVPRGP